MARRLRRRDFLNIGAGFLAGGVAGFLISSRKPLKEKPKLPIVPRFRIHTYSPEWIDENLYDKNECVDCTEFSYSSMYIPFLDVYRSGKLVNGLQDCPSNSLWMKLGDFQEKGRADYSFVCKRKGGEERLDIPLCFHNNLELISRILSVRNRADSDVYFLDSDENDLPRRCLVLSNGSLNHSVPIHYWIYGPEVLAGISKENLLKYWSSPDEYKTFESFMSSNRLEMKS